MDQEIIDVIIEYVKRAYDPILDKIEYGSTIDMPKRSFNSIRNQYDANVMLHQIYKKFEPSSHKILAITSEDIYSHGLNFVFGLAQKPGKLAIISIHRLDPQYWGLKKDEEKLFERAAKEAVHELGHSLGLGHCENSNCVMFFSNKIFDTDRKAFSLCERCFDHMLNLHG